MIRTWRITPTQNLNLEINASSLDELTRKLPDGYYSTFRTFAGCRRVLGFAAHLRRLYEPVTAPEVSESSLRRQLLALLEPYRPGEARVRLIMTGQGEAYIAAEPLKPLPRQVYEQGVRTETTELQRQHPRLKSTTFIGRSDSERKHIAEEGIFEALLVKNGEILEGMTSNFFYVRISNSSDPTRQEAVLYTAQNDILLGITRSTVIEVARGKGMNIRHEALRLDRVATIDEAFITSSSRGIVPVIQIDQVTLGQGSPGHVTKELMAGYEAYVLENAEEI